MKDIEKKVFWVTNLVAPIFMGIYFHNECDNWFGIIAPVYCALYLLCAVTVFGDYSK